MQQRTHAVTTTQLCANVWHDFRRGFSQLLAYNLFVKVIGLALLEPFSTWFFTALISVTGRLSVHNEQLLTFFLSPPGMVMLALSGTITLAVLFIERAGLMLIAAALLRGQSHTAIQALWLTCKRLPDILGLGLLTTVIYGGCLVPFVALAALSYVLLLAPHNIDYLVAVRPPLFWMAAGIAVLLGLGVLLLSGLLYVHWIFALPACLFEGKKLLGALHHSQNLTQGSVWRMASILLGWAGLMLAVTSTVTVGFDVFGEVFLASLSERLHVVIPAVAGLVMLAGLTLAVLSFFGATIHCILVIHLYDEMCARQGLSLAERPAPASEGEEVSTAPWVLLSKVLWTAAVLLPLLTTVTSVVVIEQLDLRDNIAVTAHRGSSRRAPENTLSAIRQAIADGADFAEIDVRATADGVVVLMHDDDLRRVAGVNKKIRDTTYADLKDLDVGLWFSPHFIGEPIPTLEEAIAVARGNIRLNIELKVNRHAQQLVERIVQIVRDADFVSQCIITSTSYDALQQVKRLHPALRVGHIVAHAVGDISRLDVDVLSVNTRLVTADFMRAAQQRGKEVHVWTVNDPKRMSVLIELGVHNIITSVPDVLIALLEERAELSDVERILLQFRHWLWQ
jgi:glycerophosphoryl diester phosphodiesterase